MNLIQEFQKPFPYKDLEYLPQRHITYNGKTFVLVHVYVSARAVMHRFDDVCGVMGWSDEYKAIQDNGIECTITIEIDGKKVSKTDAAPKTNIHPVKGGYSAALKRAAVKFGIGRYLYSLPEIWCELYSKKTNDGTWIYYNNKGAKVQGHFHIPSLEELQNLIESNCHHLQAISSAEGYTFDDIAEDDETAEPDDKMTSEQKANIEKGLRMVKKIVINSAGKVELDRNGEPKADWDYALGLIADATGRNVTAQKHIRLEDAEWILNELRNEYRRMRDDSTEKKQDADDRPITEKQLTLLHTLIGKKSKRTNTPVDEVKLIICEDIGIQRGLMRPLNSTKEMTAAEASRVIEKLKTELGE